MIDTIKVTRPQLTDEDLFWNDVAGKYADDGIGPIIVFEGFAAISTKGWNAQNTVSAGRTMTVSTYQVSTKLGTPEFKEDDIVDIVNSVRNPDNNGKRLIVKAPVITSYAIQQTVTAEIWMAEKPR